MELKVNDVFNSVIIQYEFKTAKEAKHFSSIFSENLEDDYSNLLDTIFVFEKRDRGLCSAFGLEDGDRMAPSG